jgi:hypothetical protein
MGEIRSAKISMLWLLLHCQCDDANIREIFDEPLQLYTGVHGTKATN